jgi:hypothetical protein
MPLPALRPYRWRCRGFPRKAHHGRSVSLHHDLPRRHSVRRITVDLHRQARPLGDEHERALPRDAGAPSDVTHRRQAANIQRDSCARRSSPSLLRRLYSGLHDQLRAFRRAAVGPLSGDAHRPLSMSRMSQGPNDARAPRARHASHRAFPRGQLICSSSGGRSEWHIHGPAWRPTYRTTDGQPCDDGPPNLLSSLGWRGSS